MVQNMVFKLIKVKVIHSTGYRDYSILFYVADVLFFFVALLAIKLDADVERMEGGNLGKGVRKLIRFFDVDVFILVMLLLGTCWGFLESFLFVFLMELEASSYLLGDSSKRFGFHDRIINT